LLKRQADSKEADLAQQAGRDRKSSDAGWSARKQTIVFVVVVVCVIVVIMLVGSLLPGESAEPEAPERVPTIPKGLDS
jgi:hypothetical protein